MFQRECWINVFPYISDMKHGRRHAFALAVSHHCAVIARGGNREPAIDSDELRGIGVGYRLHIRLKPEGAPRRYASEHDRRNWETYPEEMRTCPF